MVQARWIANEREAFGSLPTAVAKKLRIVTSKGGNYILPGFTVPPHDSHLGISDEKIFSVKKEQDRENKFRRDYCFFCLTKAVFLC